MGISQQLGASSIIKPGVCTSSTRPASPYEGQAIYETDTDKVLVYNGTAWVRTAGLGDTSTNPASSPQQIQDAGLPNGFYWIKSGSMSSAIQMYVAMNLNNSLPFARVFSSMTYEWCNLNLLNNNIPMSRLLVQREDSNFQSWGGWSSVQQYNGTTGLSVNSGSTNVSKTILGYAGGHGLYESGQTACSWGAQAGGVSGAGFDGSSCGSYPNNLVWGQTNSGQSTYTNISTIKQKWEHWVWWS